MKGCYHARPRDGPLPSTGSCSESRNGFLPGIPKRPASPRRASFCPHFVETSPEMIVFSGPVRLRQIPATYRENDPPNRPVMTVTSAGQNVPPKRNPPEGICGTVLRVIIGGNTADLWLQAAFTPSAFRPHFLRFRPTIPRPTRPDRNSGRAAGRGTVDNC